MKKLSILGALLALFAFPVLAATGTPAQSFKQLGPGSVDRTLQSKLEEHLSVKDFGARGNGVVNDTAAIQRAVTAADNATDARTRAVDDVGGASGSQLCVGFPNGTYLVNDTITGGGYTCFVALGDAVFIKNTDDTKDTIALTGYQNKLRGLHFIGGKRQLVFDRATNLDTSVVVLDRLTFSAGDYTQPAIYIHAGSSHFIIRDPRVLSRSYWLNADFVDQVTIEGGWVNGYTLSADANTAKKPANTASIVNKARLMRINGTLFVPEMEGYGASNAGTRWIDNHSMLSVSHSIFGGENAGFPIVYNYASSAATAYPWLSYTGVVIRDSHVSTGNSSRADRGVVVLQTAVPSVIELRGLAGGADVSSVINSSQMSGGSAASWLAANADLHNPHISINVIDNEIFASTYVPVELRPFARWGYQGSNGSPNTYQVNGTDIPANSTLVARNDGSATVAFASGGGSVTVHASYRTIFYTRLGRVVTLTGRIIVGSVSSPTGALSITGLPFAAGSAGSLGAGNFASCSVWGDGLAAGATTALQGRIIPGASEIVLSRFAAGAKADIATLAQANAEFNVQCTYLTD